MAEATPPPPVLLSLASTYRDMLASVDLIDENEKCVSIILSTTDGHQLFVCSNELKACEKRRIRVEA